MYTVSILMAKMFRQELLAIVFQQQTLNLKIKSILIIKILNKFLLVMEVL